MNKPENCHGNMIHNTAGRGAASGPSKESKDAGITQAVLVTKSDKCMHTPRFC